MVNYRSRFLEKGNAIEDKAEEAKDKARSLPLPRNDAIVRGSGSWYISR
ncbi:MAG: hypothetical protein ACRC78_03140 [Planktothrix sp.]